MLRVVVAMLAWLAVAASAHAQGGQRIALAIGNEAYSGALTKLNRPHDDAQRITDALRTTGFAVTQRTDRSRSEILKEVRALADRLKEAGPNAVGFFYYSGHGASALVGDRRRNYIIPVGTSIETPDDLVAEGVPLDDIIAILQRSKAKAIFIVFDACRSELPWSRGGADPDKAFNAVSAGPGMFIAYSTAEGTPAPDDGAYAAALASQLLESGKTHLAAFDAASRSVGKTRGVDRRPWYSNQIDDDIYFVSTAIVAQAASTTRVSTPPAASTTALIPRAGETFRDCSDCPQMVSIPAGSFMMGSPVSETGRFKDEGPQRRVNVPNFAAGQYEVTWAEWGRCVAAGGCAALEADGFGGGTRPVTNVSWSEAASYVKWLSSKTGQTYRLLSEAEWEYAARAGSSGRWSFGDNEGSLGTYAWYSSNFGFATHVVGTKTANAFGLHDMHGNVREWVQDCYAENYSTGQPTNGSAYSPSSCALRVLRGGSWGGNPRLLRSASRTGIDPSLRLIDLGFRVARTL